MYNDAKGSLDIDVMHIIDIASSPLLAENVGDEIRIMPGKLVFSSFFQFISLIWYAHVSQPLIFLVSTASLFGDHDLMWQSFWTSKGVEMQHAIRCL